MKKDRVQPDSFYMERALSLAKRGTGKVHPNPLVGAVIVKGGRIISEGAHEKFGGPHAEINAIQNATEKLNGSTLYCTLEPCAHVGKTPPCVDAIITAKIQKVVIAMPDPNPLVCGKGIQKLKKAGIQVVEGISEAEAVELNKDFSYWIRKKTPYVILKIAQSLDGKIATADGQSRWITGIQARIYGHEMRAASDAVLVGVNTVLKDDPLLTARDAKIKTSPLKIILDSKLQTPEKARLFSKGARVLIATTELASKEARRRLEKKAEILLVKEKKGRVDVADLLKCLGERGVVSVLVEGGAEVTASFLEARAAQEVYFFIAPKIIGGMQSKGSVGGEGVESLASAYHLKHIEIHVFDEDILLKGTLN